MTVLVEMSDPSEIASLYLGDARPPQRLRPWITLGMISSFDGSATVDDGSTGLGGPPDRAVFRALRAVADLVVVGASTARAERYRAVRLPDELVRWRQDMGLAPTPGIAIVSNSLEFDLTDSLMESRPIIVTSAASPVERRAALAHFAEVIVAGDERVDFGEAMGELRERGVERVTLEGGPTVNAQVADLLDEACVTIAPQLIRGDGPRIVHGQGGSREASLDRVIVGDDFLLLRYLFS
ncbi:MAG: dihydrofolate reductase family protein [Acidimicrobiia bacterium]